eukprot:UN5179
MRMRHALAAVPMNGTTLETYLRSLRLLDKAPKGLIRPDGLAFFNAGVLLLDLQRWREDNISRSLERMVHRFSGTGGTQLPLNLEFGTTRSTGDGTSTAWA